MIDEDITLLLDDLPVGIVRMNNERKCIYVNKYVYNTLGVLSCDAVCAQFAEIMFHEDVQIEIAYCNDFLYNHIESESQFRIFNKEANEYRWMANKRTLIKARDTTVSYLYTIQDIHDTKTKELQLRHETTKAEQAYNHKSIFLANMSHEIRTPLNGIIGMLTLLEDTHLTNDQQDYIGMVKECSYNLMTIINDILDYSKLEAGKITLDMKPMNLQECIESTNDIILSKVYEKSLEYTYSIHPDVPTHIMSDPNRLKQILLNLISNSIKFTERGNIFLNVEYIKNKDISILQQMDTPHKILRVDDPFDDSFYLRFDITDTGCGIDESDREKLFKSFSQLDNRLTSKIYQGTGLGLAISKELVELMHGCIWLDWSVPNEGSRFSFIVKTKIAVGDSICDQNECDALLGGTNVLIVDDNLHNRLSLIGMVTKWGMRPYSFSNSEEALYFARITRFDVGFIDVCMPKIDGPGFAKKLRDQSEFNNKTFPLIALSSLGDNLSKLSKHFKTHLLKPIKEQKLKRYCIDALRHHFKTHPYLETQNVPKSILAPAENQIDSYMIENNITELRDNIRILLAEDVYINQCVIIKFLNKMGFKNITVTDNGQHCLEMAISQMCDIILLDIRMPVMNGEVVLQEVKKHYKKTQCEKMPYIIAVTAYCLREDKDKYLTMGFDDYIPKPISLADLTNCMNKFVEKLLLD